MCTHVRIGATHWRVLLLPCQRTSVAQALEARRREGFRSTLGGKSVRDDLSGRSFAGAFRMSMRSAPTTTRCPRTPAPCKRAKPVRRRTCGSRGSRRAGKLAAQARERASDPAPQPDADERAAQPGPNQGRQPGSQVGCRAGMVTGWSLAGHWRVSGGQLAGNWRVAVGSLAGHWLSHSQAHRG